MIIDFDKKFREHIQNWMKENADKFATPEDMEMQALDVYSTWLNEPADFLEGKAPNEYFGQYENADELVSILVEFLNFNVGVPDLLLDAISEFGEQTKQPLTKLFNAEYNVDDKKQDEARMLSINLLAEIDDTFMYDDYIKLLVDKDTSDEVANLIVERLEYADKETAEKIIKGIENIDDENIKIRCVDVLVNFPGDDRIYNILISMFNEYTNTALLAAYLGKYGDDRAVTMLKEALDWEGINYLDYIEIKRAIEDLGSEVDHVRTFEGDTYYESLKNIE